MDRYHHIIILVTGWWLVVAQAIEHKSDDKFCGTGHVGLPMEFIDNIISCNRLSGRKEEYNTRIGLQKFSNNYFPTNSFDVCK